MEHRTVRRGYETIISIGSYECNSCEFVDPQGTSYPLTKGPCNLRMTFEFNHDGIWHANCNVPGRMEPFVYKYNLTVAGANLLKLSRRIILIYIFSYFFSDEHYELKVDTDKTSDQKGRINLHCMPNFESQVCQFIRPDSKVLNVHPGIGDDQ